MSGQNERETISRTIEISSIQPEGARFVIEPTADERAAIAERLAAPSIDRLTGDFLVTPVRGGAEVTLRLKAAAGRICVASLEPMTEEIDEEIRMLFDRSFNQDTEEEDGDGLLREPLDGDEIDLGELLVQHLSLSLAPYPRKEGADSLAQKYCDAASTSPFDALKGLAARES